MPAFMPSSINSETLSGLSISALNLSCCNSSRFFNVGPGYVRYFVYGGCDQYCRYERYAMKAGFSKYFREAK